MMSYITDTSYAVEGCVPNTAIDLKKIDPEMQVEAIGKMGNDENSRLILFKLIPLNDTVVKMIEELRQEFYFGEDTPLVCNEHGNVTNPDVFRRRYHRLLEGAGIESKGLHALHHTFATNLVNGVKQADGTVKSLTLKQVADLLGHSTTQVTEMYYVKKDTSMLNGITNDFCL